jgi:Bacterial PH domain/Short C-terminal domain
MRFGRFPPSLLSEDEDLVLDLRPHWIALARPFAQAVAILGGVVLVWLLSPFRWGGWFYALTLLAAAILFAVFPARPVTRWATSHFVVTSDRVMRRSGWIAKEAMEISLENLSDVRFHQSISERLIGAGDLMMESAGRSGQELFHDVRNPERVQKVIFQMKERNATRQAGGGHSSTRMPVPAPSIADELAKLHRLRGQGVLTDAEFQAVKARLLSRV